MRISVNLATRPFVELRPLFARLRLAMVLLALLAVGLGFGLRALNAKARAAQAQMDALKAKTQTFQQERLANDRHSIAIEQIRTDDDVGDAGLVLERQEDESLRGAGALTRNHHPRHADAAAVARLRQIRGAQHAAQRKVVAAQRHRVRADREPHA